MPFPTKSLKRLRGRTGTASGTGTKDTLSRPDDYRGSIGASTFLCAVVDEALPDRRADTEPAEDQTL